MSSLRRFFSEEPIDAEQAVLKGEEARHATAVNRLRPGDEAVLFDGSGREFRARLVEGRKRAAVFAILGSRVVDREWPVRVTVASAVPKGKRADYMVEKLCELGAAGLIPLWCERSVVDPRVRSQNRVSKWTRTVVEASKQCGRNRLMEIERAVGFAEMLERVGEFAAGWICEPGPETERIEARAAGDSALVVVGPEGGFSPDELAGAKKFGLRRLVLAPAILRTETAATAAVGLVASFCNV